MMALHASAGEVAGRKAPAPARPSEPSILQPLQDALCDNFFGDDFYKGQNKLKGKFREKCRQTTSFDQIDQVLKAEQAICQERCTKTHKENICLKQACLEKCVDEEASAELSKDAFDRGEKNPEDPEKVTEVITVICTHSILPELERYLNEKAPIRPFLEMESITRLKGTSTRDRELFTCEQVKNRKEANKALKLIQEACVTSCKDQAKKKVAQGLKEEAVKCAEQACEDRCAGYENAGKKALDMFGRGQAASL